MLIFVLPTKKRLSSFILDIFQIFCNHSELEKNQSTKFFVGSGVSF